MVYVWRDAKIRQHAIRNDYQGDGVETTRRYWAQRIQLCSHRDKSASPAQLRYPIGIATPFETNYSRGHLIHSRSPPDEIRFYWLREKSLSRSCIKSTERSTLNIWHGKSESITSEQMPLLLLRKSALCGNDLCHVPLIMVMIALEGVSWDVIQRAAKREWQGHPKWQ